MADSLMTDLIPTDEDDDYVLPKYGDVGWILARLEATDHTYWRYEVEVLDYSGSAFWIKEGMGFDYWFSEYVDLDIVEPTYIVLEGVTGYYRRGNGYSTDDDEEWEFTVCRRASPKEIEQGTVDDRAYTISG